MARKKTKYSYVVDLTKATTEQDTLIAFGLAKHNAGLAMTNDELCAICLHVADVCFPPTVILIENVCEYKKTPWYKRVWSKLFGSK